MTLGGAWDSSIRKQDPSNCAQGYGGTTEEFKQHYVICMCRCMLLLNKPSRESDSESDVLGLDLPNTLLTVAQANEGWSFSRRKSRERRFLPQFRKSTVQSGSFCFWSSWYYLMVPWEQLLLKDHLKGERGARLIFSWSTFVMFHCPDFERTTLFAKRALTKDSSQVPE